MKLAWQSVLLLPVLVVVTQAQSTCEDGIEGIDGNGVVCCPLECGKCGGDGCPTFGAAFGLGVDSCCGNGIKAGGKYCDVTGEAPCIYGSPPAGECSGGIEGIDGNGVICCPLECGLCGGTGCSEAGEASGLGSGSCCGGGVKNSGRYCDITDEAPCIYGSPPDGTCSNGLEGIDGNGEVCCPLECGACGGFDCGNYGRVFGLGSESCCGGGIMDSGIMCSDSRAAPCIQDGAVPTSPTPTITTPTPTPNPSPTPVMTIPTSCTGSLPTFRYAATSGKVGKGRLYAESEGCFTMTDLYNFRGTEKDGSSKGPVYMLDSSGNKVTAPTSVTKRWLLEAELYVTDGAIFYCIGSDEGGDCDELRIQSTGPDDWYEVRGHGGSMYFSHTVVTSWDTPNRKPQETYEGGRSFLNCVSEKLTGETCDGRAKNDEGECRMDIISSEMGYMGFLDAESYGLTWKVRGFCKDLSNPDVFETTNVYGDIKDSDIHHMYYGMYSYGHQGGVWTGNKMHDNHQYGFDPHDDSDYLTIANNKVYDNYNHGIIASKRCNNVKIYNNEVSDGGPDAVGIFLHRSSDDAQVYDNKIWNMPDAGIALLESFGADIHDNEVDGAQFGIRMSLGSGSNNVYDNEFNDISDWGLYTYEGSDDPDVSNGRPNGNTFNNNKITNTDGGVKIKNSDNIVITNNDFTGTDELEFFNAQATTWSGNSLPSGVCIDNITSDDGSSVTRSTFSSSSGLPSTEC